MTKRNLVRHPDSSARPERGFSVLELIVALFIAVEILIAMAIAFDVHNRVARVQLQVTDMQQALRIAQWDIARTVRHAGRGMMKAGLNPGAEFDPTEVPPHIPGRAIEVRNNVAGDDRYLVRGTTTGQLALEGTDILTVRGCISTDLFQINPGEFDGDSNEDGNPGDAGGNATVRIPAVSVAGVPQPWTDLQAELAAHPGPTVFGRILLGSYLSTDDWGIADVTDVNVDGDVLVLTVRLAEAGTSTSPLNVFVDADNDPATAPVREFPTTLSATSACLLEEYRYYIRQVVEASDPITPLRPRLTRARFEPGTETPFQGNNANLTLDLADQIFDLQVALGFDSDNAGSMNEDSDDIGDDDLVWEPAEDGAAPGQDQDDWLYNDPGDAAGCDVQSSCGESAVGGCDPATAVFVCHNWTDPLEPSHSLVGTPTTLYLVRITTAARTARPDPTYQAPDLDTRVSGDWIEDHNYDDPSEPASIFNDETNRKHRRRLLTTIVEMRNI